MKLFSNSLKLVVRVRQSKLVVLQSNNLQSIRDVVRRQSNP